MTDIFRCGLAIVFLASPATSVGQTPPPSAAGAPGQSTTRQTTAGPCGNTATNAAASHAGAPDAGARADVELMATVTARSLRFETVASGANITLTPASDSSVCILEHNLPSPLEPNRTYTDVVIKLLVKTNLETLSQAAGPRR